MKKITTRLIAFMLVVATACAMAVPAMATEQDTGVTPYSSAYITAVWASCSSGTGKITVDFDIMATGRMTSLGATLIEIKDSSGTTKKVFRSSTTDGMMGSNQTYYTSSVTWNGATSGSKYYAVVYYKASNSSGYDTTSYTTSYCYAG